MRKGKGLSGSWMRIDLKMMTPYHNKVVLFMQMSGNAFIEEFTQHYPRPLACIRTLRANSINKELYREDEQDFVKYRIIAQKRTSHTIPTDNCWNQIWPMCLFKRDI